MKSRKMWFVTALLALVVAATGLAFTGCSKDPVPTITVTSEQNPVLRPGDLYELTYTTTDATEVSVAASGGTYIEEDKTFTSTEAGAFTLTITAKNKSQEAAATVNVTVLNATPLGDAIASAKNLVRDDYTSFAAVTTALNAAKTVYESDESTQAEIDEALSALNTAVQALSPKAVVKAEIVENSVTFGGKVYDDENYANFSELKAEFTALNENTAITLNSAYQTAFNVIVKKLVKRPALEVFGLSSGVTMLQKMGAVTYTATVEEGASLEWFIDGESKGTENTLTFTPAAGTQYAIKAVAKKGEIVNEKTYNVSYQAMTVTSAHENIVVADGVITANQFTTWDASSKRKVGFDFDLEGDFVVMMDVKMNEIISGKDNAAFAIILNTGSVDDAAGEYAVRYRYEEKQELSYHGNDIRSGSDAVGDRLGTGKTITLVLTRKDMGTNAAGAAISKYEWYILENGQKVAYLSKSDDTAFHDLVTMSLNFENLKAEVSNIRVSGGLVDKSALSQAVNTYQSKIDSHEMTGSDYSNWSAFSTQLTKAKTMLKTVKAGAADVAAQLTALNDAFGALTLKAVTVIEPTNESFTFNGKEYKATLYGNYAEQILAIGAVNARAAAGYEGEDKIVKQSAYDAEIQVLCDALTPNLVVTGTEEGTYVYSGAIPEVKWTAAGDTLGTPKNVAWSVNGGEFSAESSEFTLPNPQFGTEYTVVAKGMTEGVEVTVTKKVTFQKAAYAVNSEMADKILIDGEKLIINKYMNWGDAGDVNKVWLSNVALSGDFEVSADFTYFTGYGDKHVAAMFLEQGWKSGNKFEMGYTGYVAAVYVDGGKNSQIEYNTRDGEKIVKDVVGRDAAFDPNTTLTYSIKRVVNTAAEPKTASYTYSLLSKGEVLASYTVNDNPNTDAVRVSFNCEHFLGEISNIVIRTGEKGVTVERGELVSLTEQAKALSPKGFDVEDGATAMFFAVNQPTYANGLWPAYNFNSTQEEVAEALTALKADLAGLKAKKAVIEENTVAFAGKTYARADYANFNEVKAAAAAVTGDGIAYVTEMNDCLAALVPLETIELSALSADLFLTESVGKVYRLTDGKKTIVKVVADETELTAEADGSYLFAPTGQCHVVTVTYEDETTLVLNLNATTKNSFKLVHGRYESRVIISEDGTQIDVVQNTNWDESFTQVVIGDQVYSGDFIQVNFDATYNGGTDNGTRVLMMAFVNADMGKDPNARRKPSAFAAVRYKFDNTSELCAAADGWNEGYDNTPDRTKDDANNGDIVALLQEGSTNHFRVTRDAVAKTLSLELLDENGAVVGRKVSHQIGYTGPVRIIWNFEHALVTVSDISVLSQAQPTDRNALSKTIVEADVMFMDAYEQALAAAVQEKLGAALMAYGNPDATQAEVDTAETELAGAIAAAKAGAVDETKIAPDRKIVVMENPCMMEVGGNYIVVNGAYDWGAGDDRKIVLPEIIDSDYIEVSFKVRFNALVWDGGHVFAFEFLNENNMKRETTFVVNYNDKFMRVEANNQNIDQQNVGENVALGMSVSIKVVRVIENGKAAYTFTMWNYAGELVGESQYTDDNAFKGRTALGFNLEHVGATISNISVVTTRPEA